MTDRGRRRAPDLVRAREARHAPKVSGRALRVIVGGLIGMLGGGIVLLAVVVARANFAGEYLESLEDLLHWQSTPLIAAPALGMMFGYAGRAPLIASLAGSVGGLLLGIGAGAAIGATMDLPHWPWALGVIGGGAGMMAGGVIFGIREWVRQDVRESHQRAELASR
jgi:hypothetical protein